MTRLGKKISLVKNLALSMVSYKKGDLRLKNMPTLLWIEPTNKCNLKCVMCPNKNIDKDQLGFMKWDLYKKIIDEVSCFASSAYLLLAGESMLHKDIYKMIRYAKDNGIRPLLNTNGTLLAVERNRKMLLDSGIAHITFAFDGYNSETYERIRVGANFNKTINGIIEFLREKKRRNLSEPYVAITTLETGIEKYVNKEEEKRRFYSLFDGLPVDEFIIKTPNTWGGTFAGSGKFACHELDKSNFYPCSHLWSTMSVYWDGTVVPCCFDFFKTYVLGDVNKKTLKEIWNDEPMVKLRRSMLDGTYKTTNRLCNGCVILHLDPVLGVPAGMRTAVKDAITNIVGMRAEKYLIKFAKKIRPSYSLRIDG